MAPVLLQDADPLQLFETLWLNENDVVLVCAYAIGAATAIVAAAIAPTARIVANIGNTLFIIALF
jgi:ABC-type tungstate transport system substrate-binding protein